MQRVSLVALSISLLLSSAASRQLAQDGGSCKKIVRASSTSNSNGGITTTFSFGTARATTETTNPLADAVGNSINRVVGGGSVDAEVDITATAIARAIIDISLGAEVVTTVEGSGSGCGSASAITCNTLSVVAEAVSRAFAQAENDFAIAQADAVAEAIQEATISLDAEVTAKACSQGGRSEAAQTLKGKKGLLAIAQAITRAYTIISGKDQGDSVTESISDSKIKETGTLKGESFTDVQGVGTADTTATANVFICSSEQIACCDPQRRFQNFCFCGPTCTVTKFPENGDKVLILNTPDGTRQCKCN